MEPTNIRTLQKDHAKKKIHWSFSAEAIELLIVNKTSTYTSSVNLISRFQGKKVS